MIERVLYETGCEAQTRMFVSVDVALAQAINIPWSVSAAVQLRYSA